MEAEESYLSEVHIGCHPGHDSHVSVFTFANTDSLEAVTEEEECLEEKRLQQGPGLVDSTCIELDDNGDMVLPRRHPKASTQRRRRQYDCAGEARNHLVVNHRLATGLSQVGLQVWKGGLLLADFLLSTPQCYEGATVIELGAGTGLAGLVAAQAARLVFITDIGTDVLDNCLRNVILNNHLVGDGGHGGGAVRVRELDWLDPWPPAGNSASGPPYGWTADDVAEAQEASVIIAADVIYSVEMTEGFFQVLANLIPYGSMKVLYLALERRYNFSLRERDVVAHCYREFRNCFRHVKVPVAEDQQGWGFVGEQLAVSSIPQSIVEYDRGGDLELWKIWRHVPPRSGTT